MAIFDEAERLVLQALRPLRMRLNNAIRRAVVKAYNDATKQGELQVSVMADELQDDIEYAQHYGLASSPPVGSECVMLRIGASGDHQVVIATMLRDKRPKLAAEGDVKLWDLDGQTVALERGAIALTPKSGNDVDLGGGATKGVNRAGDTVSANAAFVTWLAAVGTFTGAGAPPSPHSATDGGSTVVKAVD